MGRHWSAWTHRLPGWVSMLQGLYVAPRAHTQSQTFCRLILRRPPLPTPFPLPPTTLLFVFISLSFRSEIVPFFSVWLFSLSIVFSGPIHAVANVTALRRRALSFCLARRRSTWSLCDVLINLTVFLSNFLGWFFRTTGICGGRLFSTLHQNTITDQHGWN